MDIVRDTYIVELYLVIELVHVMQILIHPFLMEDYFGNGVDGMPIYLLDACSLRSEWAQYILVVDQIPFLIQLVNICKTVLIIEVVW